MGAQSSGHEASADSAPPSPLSAGPAERRNHRRTRSVASVPRSSPRTRSYVAHARVFAARAATAVP